MLPTHKHNSHSCFFNFTEQKVHKLKNMLQGLKNVLGRHVFVSKAILSSDPRRSRAKSFSIVIMYGYETKLVIGKWTQLAIYNHKDNEDNKNNILNEWTSFGDGEHSFLLDITYHNNHLYASQYNKNHIFGSLNSSVEVWNFDYYFPMKVETL